MADAPAIRFESRMLIDGKLVDGEAGRFININPATEDVGRQNGHAGSDQYTELKSVAYPAA